MSERATPITGRLTASLYTEAMLLADEARSYFDREGQDERNALPPRLQVGFACEALGLTTRLMQIIAWLLTRKAIEAGELPGAAASEPYNRLGQVPDSDAEVVALLPPSARRLIAAGTDLYERIARLDDADAEPPAGTSPARSLLQRLERSF